MIIIPITTANGKAYSPVLVSCIIDCCILGIKRCPVILYNNDMPIKKSPEPKRHIIK